VVAGLCHEHREVVRPRSEWPRAIRWEVKIVENRQFELVQGVLTEARRLGLAHSSIEYYASRCRTVVGYCEMCGVERLSEQVVDEFLASMDGRLRRGEIGGPTRSTLEKTVRMMLEFQQMGMVTWRRRRPASGLGTDVERVLQGLAESLRDELAVGSVRLVVGEAGQFFAYLARTGRALSLVTTDDVRGFLVEVRPRHTSGMNNTVWAMKRLFRFLNQQGITDLRVEGLLARVGLRRIRALPCFTADEARRIVTAIETDSQRGKRDYAMVRLALSTGLRCCDIVSLRLDGIDWRRDEIRLVQQKTAAPLTLPLSAEAGNALADWILNARPVCDAFEVFVRIYAPFEKLTGPTGANIMNRWLDKAGVAHQAHDGKTFHALRRTIGTRLVESGAELALTAQVLGHARVDSSRRYIVLADESLRICCLPLDVFASTKDGLR
jgi:integrase